MINLIVADTFRLKKQRVFFALLLISCISAISMIVIAYYLTEGKLSDNITNAASGLTEAPITCILGPIMACIIISGDFEDRSIQDSISIGYGIKTIIISKSILYFFLVFLIQLPYIVVTVVAMGTGYKFTASFGGSVYLNILEHNAGLNYSGQVFAKLIAIAFTTTFIYAAQLSICIWLAFMIKKQVTVVTIGFVILTCLQLVMISNNDSIIMNLLSITPFAVNSRVLTLSCDNIMLIKVVVGAVLFEVFVLLLTCITIKYRELE